MRPLFAKRRNVRIGVWLLLLPLMLLQFRAAAGACIVGSVESTVVVVAVAAAGGTQTAALDDCCPDSGIARQICVGYCKQSVDSPSPAIDHGLGVVAFDLSHSIMRAPSAGAMPAVAAVPAPTATGPPAFLRHLRLLI